MDNVTRPGIGSQVIDQMGSKRIAFDIAEDRQQVIVVLNDGALEPALPDMTGAKVAAMIVPGVGHGQGLQNATDALSLTRLQEQMKVIVQEAITKEAEGIALFGLPQGIKKGKEIAGVEKHGRAIVAAIDGMVDQTITNEPRQPSHAARLFGSRRLINEKKN